MKSLRRWLSNLWWDLWYRDLWPPKLLCRHDWKTTRYRLEEAGDCVHGTQVEIRDCWRCGKQQILGYRQIVMLHCLTCRCGGNDALRRST